MIDTLVEEFWKPILVVMVATLLWVFWQIEEKHIAHLQAQVTQYQTELADAQKEIDTQNAAVLAEQAKGKTLQAELDAAAELAKNNAGKVEIQWKTKYVPQPLPADCTAAVAAVASNAASVAQIFSQSPN